MLTTSSTLLERLRLPDQPEAWERFVRLYSPLLRQWVSRQGFREADAADLTQDVLVKLLALLPSYTRLPGVPFRNWLYRVTANQCHDFRRRRATRELPGDGGPGVLDKVETDSGADFEEVEYRRAVVHRALALIRPEFTDATWAAFERHILGGLSAPDVAAELHVTPNAVYLARHRVLTRLRLEIDGFLG